MRYAGQTHGIAVPLPSGHLERDRATVLLVAFVAAYNALYTEVQEGHPVETPHWRLTVSGPHLQVPIEVAMTPGAKGQPKGERQVYFPVGGFCSTPVYDRYTFRPAA
jgi:hypothetical protein